MYQNGAAIKPEYVDILKQFEKVYIYNDRRMNTIETIKEICKKVSHEKIYLLDSKCLTDEYEELIKIHTDGKFDFNKMIENAKIVDSKYYEEEKPEEQQEMIEDKEQEELQEPEEHVVIANEVMNRLYIKYYNEDFYVYSAGVYRRNKNLVEQTILDIEPNAKKNLRSEVLEYIRINKYVKEMQLNDQFINFKNGMFDLVNKKLIEHSPSFFTTCQIHASYLEDDDIVKNEYVEKFLNDVTCCNINTLYNLPRKKTLLQVIGYCMTARVNLATAFFFYGPLAKNGKSTAIEMINELIRKRKCLPYYNATIVRKIYRFRINR